MEKHLDLVAATRFKVTSAGSFFKNGELPGIMKKLNTKGTAQTALLL